MSDRFDELKKLISLLEESAVPGEIKDYHGREYPSLNIIDNDAAKNFQRAVDLMMDLEDEIVELEKDAEILRALRANGVDNWQGWDDAMDMVGDD